MNHTAEWIWCASGKHPVAKDYFSLGTESPLFKAFSDWAGNGYMKWLMQPSRGVIRNSWRFWAKGLKKNNLLCGIIKDSSDQFGRLYPLLIMGSGSLKDWESHWDLLPFALTTAWEKMEYLFTGKRLTDFKQLEEEILQLQCPSNDWSAWKTIQEQTYPMLHGYSYETLSKGLNDFWKSSDCLIALNNHFLSEPLKTAGTYHALLKDRLPIVPNAVFMGGVPEITRIGVFGRALMPDDFVKLWSPDTTSLTGKF